MINPRVWDRAHWARGTGTVLLRLTPAGCAVLGEDGRTIDVHYAQGPLGRLRRGQALCSVGRLRRREKGSGAEFADGARGKVAHLPRSAPDPFSSVQAPGDKFARVLFNHDLPWNPMDVEQRIGRIHRYGQQYTAQVYNLVSAEAIEGQIYLLLEEKLLEIGKALGKVDEQGQVAEDLREQILGQLSEQLSYERLYQDAIQDPTLVRTKEELEVAIENATTARTAVFELFQDMDDFCLDDYREFDDQGEGIQRLLDFVRVGVQHAGGRFATESVSRVRVAVNDQPEELITTDRDEAISSDELTLLGLEHPLVQWLMSVNRGLLPEDRGLAGVLAEADEEDRGVLTYWHVHVHGQNGHYQQRIVPLGVSTSCERSPRLERLSSRLRELHPSGYTVRITPERRKEIADQIPEMLQRELSHKGWLPENASFSSKLLAWIEVVGGEPN